MQRRKTPFSFSPKPHETLIICFSGIVAVLSLLVLFGQNNAGPLVRSLVTCALGFAMVLVRSRKYFRSVSILNAIAGLFQVACVMAGLLFVFQAVGSITIAIHPRDYDRELIAVDRFLFGGISPSLWIAEHLTPSKIAVEVMQFCYFLYYLLPLAVGSELWLRVTRGKSDIHDFDTFTFTMIFAFFLSCVGYLLVPAIGPRFTLHDFWSISRDMPGLWITEFLRQQTNAGELISESMTSSEAAKVVLRDAFPSGHTMMTLVALTLGFRFRTRVRWFILPIGIGLIAATIYLRYHYVADVLGGLIFAWVALKSAPAVAHWLKGRSPIPSPELMSTT